MWNYEIGEKAKAFGNWLTINTDIYYIKWKGVQQVFILPCGYQYYDNAGDGRSFGPEIEVNAKLSEAWSVFFSGAWTDSKLTTPNASYTNFLTGVATRPDGVTPPCIVGSSCAVPIMNVVKDTASLTLTYSTEVLSGYNLTASTADSYTGTSHDVAYYFDSIFYSWCVIQPTSRGPLECRLIKSFNARRIYGAGFISTGGEPSSPPSVSRCTA